MRIGVDARELAGHPTGVGRYLGELLARWADGDGGAATREWVLYAPGTVAANYRAAIDRLGATIRLLPGSSGTRWEQLSLARAATRDRVDVLFAPAYTAPLGVRAPVVLTVHDVSFVARPEWFRTRERIRRVWLTRRAARRARVVLTVSEFSRREIVRWLGVPAERVRVVLHGRPAGPGSGDRAPERRAPLVLYVGSIFNRRRLPDLVRAFSLVVDRLPPARLAIVGENRTWPHQDLDGLCRAAGVRSRVDLHDYVAEDRLAELYGRAACFVFLSEYEGFGLTPLEALAHGVPPVLLDTAVARETCGPAAVYVQPGDLRSTAEAIADVMADGEIRRSVLGAAEGVLCRYSWERAARETLAALDEAAR